MKKEQIKARLSRLKNAMKEHNIALYIIPMNDYHGSEYIGDHFKLIRYFSGFTGSAGTLVVTETEVYLWTDGRYFLQAGQQLCGTGILLQKMGETDVPSISDFVKQYFDEEKICKKSAVGFDGRLVSSAFAEKLGDLPLASESDLAGDIWNRDEEEIRPELLRNPVWILDKKYSGQETEEKLALIREDMKKEGADVLLLSTLDDIAYLTNLRGSDIAYNPVFLSYMIITQKKAELFSFITDSEIKDYLDRQGIVTCSYESFYENVQKISKESSVWIDMQSASYCMLQALPKECKKITKTGPVIIRKAIKNATEIENIKKAHRKDGVAVTKFIYWLKNSVSKGLVRATEMSGAEQLIKLRRQQEEYIGESFSPILAFGEHGAIVHYSADEATDAELTPSGFLLADTGGHYRNGTTDITRTIAMGPLTAQQKEYYTAVLKGNLRLAGAKFKQGIMGAHLDYLAREPLYRLGMDFRHGTGHGVGYLLNVHEGPNGFRMRQEEESAFKAGMVTSNEPGLYLDGQYGIRLENLILCVEEEKTEYGQFLSFRPLTMVPFDRDAIAAEMLSQEEKESLNAYHKEVYDTISQELSEEERQWLAEVTAPI